VIDYVIVHELVHLIEPNHTPLFWQQVGRVLPDYEQRKIWLAEKGGPTPGSDDQHLCGSGESQERPIYERQDASQSMSSMAINKPDLQRRMRELLLQATPPEANR
jgi:hypothetical protein